MKNLINPVIISAVIFLFFNFNGCNKTDSPSGGGNTNCPDNNSFQCATPLTLGVNSQDNISANDDIDFFQFYFSQDGVTEIAITNVPSNINLNVYLYDNGQSTIARSENTGLGESVYLIKGQGSGTGYIKIYDRDQNASNSNAYSIMVTEDISDIYELNENNTTAKLIQQNTTLQAKFRPNDDYDWYQFTTAQDGVIDITLSNVPSNINVHARLYNNIVNEIITSENNGLGQGFTLSAARKQGLHFIRLYDQNNDANSTNYYNFSANLDISDVYEYNNTREDAKAINVNSDYQAKIRPKNDYDYFQFNLNSAGNIIINVTNVPANINICVSVYNNTGYEIARSSNAGNGQPVIFPVNNLQSGVYYVRYWDLDEDFSNTQFYNFRINK